MSEPQSAEQIIADAWAAGWEVPPELNVWQWADENRILSGKGAAEPGAWRTDRVPYAREPMEMLSLQSAVQRVVLMWASQTSKTENANNWLGYIIHHAPGPVLFVMPTLNDLKKNVLQRINPMIEETPVLRERVAKAAARDAANNMFVKEFPGGMLLLSGANSASALASMPIRYLYGDEIDRWPFDVDGEGSPIDLAEQRTQTFQARKKILLTSTPTLKGMSAIEREYLASDRRKYFVPCPHCGHMQHLRWKDEDGIFRLRWERDKDGKHLPKTAKYLCEGCGVLIEERFKSQMLTRGQWQATAPGDGITVGYHLNGLYSPFMTWAEMAASFLKAKDYPEKLKTWTNTKLAETFEDAGEGLNANVLAGRLEKYDRSSIPHGAAVLIGSADVQGDRIEAKIIAFGAGEESWLVDYEIFWGDPSTDSSVWQRLDDWRRREFAHPAGRPMKIAIFGVDSGDGTKIGPVYDYVQPRQHERVFAVKGRDYISRPGMAMESTARNSHVRLFLVATMAAKDRILARLRIQKDPEGKPQPGYMHLPEWIPEQYLDQMTAERKMVKKNPRTGGVKVGYFQFGRNEALDLEVYCTGLLFALQHIINPAMYRDLGRLHQQIISGQPIGQQQRTRGVRSAGINAGQ
jgi:phage terminase large subunit GpA-like protein